MEPQGYGFVLQEGKAVATFQVHLRGFKVGKTKFTMMLRESADPNILGFHLALKTGRKWKVSRDRVCSAIAAA